MYRSGWFGAARIIALALIVSLSAAGASSATDVPEPCGVSDPSCGGGGGGGGDEGDGNTQPYFLNVPQPITVDATGPEGAVVFYSPPKAFDEEDGSLPMFLSPERESGSVFPVGITTLEWATPTPPGHGNFTFEPVVYRGPYEYSVPGADKDYTPQWEAPKKEPAKEPAEPEPQTESDESKA